MVAVAEVQTPDGRSLRRVRNRDAVLDAVIGIFEEGDLDPSVDAIAERARVSNRSIYRYFDHRDHLIRTAISHALRRVAPELLLDDRIEGAQEERIERFVARQLHLYEQLAPIARAARVAAVSEPIIAEEFEVARLRLRTSILVHFADEFDGLAPSVRDRTLISAELAFQFDSFEFLWTATDGRASEMRAILEEHLRCCIARLRADPGTGV
ncbi:MAG: TetR/AcrR family transcriptional regulator [Ilumatobacter sp.]|uniref:TetR/AcrR family transcriptional regulator n=1 Tax=Ilumatobacter sp. TaxID=1967498 RepID=UPI003296F011